MNDEACTSRYAAFPLMLQSNCNPQVEACVKACPPNNASTTSETNSESVATPSNKPSVSDKLKELASLHKQGLITDSEYAAKKQEILKSM